MTAPTLRAIGFVGALATGLLVAAAPVALADTGDDLGGAGTTGPEDPTTPEGGGGGTPTLDGTPGDGSPAGEPNRPTSTVGNGRNDVRNDGVSPDEPIADGPGDEAKTARKYKSSFLIPVLRIPTWKEFAEPGFTPPSAYFGTAEIPSFADIFGAMSQPEPEPTPGPAFRTQPEAPVIDSTPGDGGGVDQLADADGPPVLGVPLVVAPPMPVTAGARLAPIGASAARAVPVPAGAQPGVAGARTPLIRGSLPPSAPAAARPLTATNGQPTQAGYPRSLRNPTVGELSAVALPGVAGLMFLTFSGGLIGYRQANSARFVRTTAAARFLQ